jgi:phosphoglycerate dehydrogenase-like enzyme
MSIKLGVPVGLFARIPMLRNELLRAHPQAKLHEVNRVFDEDEVIDFLRGCDAAIIGLEPITDRVLGALPELRAIGKFGVGLETIDFEAVRKHGVRFGYTAGVNRLAVAELALCFAIAALRGVAAVNHAMRSLERPRQNLGRQLTGRVVGIHGCGHIGKVLVQLLKPFACTVLACDIRNDAAQRDFYAQHGVSAVSFEELLQRSEVLSIHVPLTEHTRNLYDDRALGALRPDCVLINTCRGFIVDEVALRDRLASGRLLAACFDVFAIEPAIDDALLRLPNFLATPHIGASAVETRLAMAQAAIRGVTENALVTKGQFDNM